jgi:hypothetical protein
MKTQLSREHAVVLRDIMMAQHMSGGLLLLLPDEMLPRTDRLTDELKQMGMLHKTKQEDGSFLLAVNRQYFR